MIVLNDLNAHVYNTEIPIIEVNALAQNGVLHFAKKSSFEGYITKLMEGTFLNDNFLPKNFRTLNDYIIDHKRGKPKISQFNIIKLNTEFAKYSSEALTVLDNSESIDGSLEDYVFSQYTTLVPDHYLPYVLNENLQIMIDNVFYQITPLGTFVVTQNSMEAFTNWYTYNINNIWNVPNFIIPNEISLGDGLFQIAEGIQRLELNIPHIIESNSNTTPPTISIPPTTGVNPSGPKIPMHLIIADDRGEGRGLIGMSDRRRFNFNSFNNRYVFWQAVGIQGRIQRLRRVLWMSYWGESFGDEIIIGADNLDLETGYIIPTPQVMAANSMALPKFKGFKKLKIGSHITDFVEWIIGNGTLPIIPPRLSPTVVSNFMNGVLNSPHTTNSVNDVMKDVIPGLVNQYIDPSFRQRYIGEPHYITSMKSIQNAHKLRITLGQVYIKQGHSNRNNWTFDYNVMLSMEGDLAYGYKIKSGNFIGKAKIGDNWAGIRIVKFKK